ncbi:delta 8-sphingoloid desaturase protein [Dacryopinax primogenitus]|uniref:Delta 8-(E)-sphingolipid desaturase n=1 Tax=Dacryopinax primogenitus (strain DJM 731) TaxID=1858805 RepID=M5FV60_DACPD|nr:delta 8-sphingoloid desaturase protein [Dacryopinax primogenitus]EJT99489.1 delta 8-sphingoloid desaturase protein [Dacryopinax primogenitus]
MASPNHRLWTRTQVAQAIKSGQTLVIYNGNLLRIPDSWLAQHPGGRLAIQHYIGRDATGEIDGFHSPYTLASRLKNYVVGRVDYGEEGWTPLLPPLETGWVRKPAPGGKWSWVNEAARLPSGGESEFLLIKKADMVDDAGPPLDALEPRPTSLLQKAQHTHALALRELHEEIKKQGLYKCRYLTGYGPEMLRYTLFAVLSIWLFRTERYLLSAVVLGILWHQLTFVAHDLGHCGVTGDWFKDRVLGIIIADLLGGLSIGWWVDNHNIHHLVTNHPTHDPDIQHLPFFAITPRFFNSLWSTYYNRIMSFDLPSRILIRIQPYTYYPILSLARFNLYANSYLFLLGDRGRYRLAELGCIVLFWTWFSAILSLIPSPRTRLLFFLITQIVPSPVHVQIVQSHFARSTADLGPWESFPDRQLRTTTDVSCPSSMEWVHGGLQLQVTHHLFPRLPRHNLKAASKLVKLYAQEQGLEYAEFGFVETNGQVLGVLREVANQVEVFCKVAKAEAEGNLSQGN